MNAVIMDRIFENLTDPYLITCSVCTKDGSISSVILLLLSVIGPQNSPNFLVIVTHPNVIFRDTT